MNARAFAPGHITGFFEVCMKDTEATSGSRGAGICLSQGATATVKQSDMEKTVLVNGHPDGEVTRVALDILTAEPLQVDIALDLPISQGFGMSAAGTLAATLASASLLGISRHRAVVAAHVAEVRCLTGLGDVLPAVQGGLEIRESPGVQGRIKKIPAEGRVVLAVVGPPLATKEVLQNTHQRNRVNAAGKACLTNMLSAPSLNHFFTLSHRFAVQTGLLQPVVASAVQAASEHGMATMCMLGNAVCAVGDTDALRNALTPLGEVTVCEIDQHGARLLE